MTGLVKILVKILIIFAIVWTILTIWAQYSGTTKSEIVEPNGASQNALIVYNPDPIYNLDEQICRSAAEELSLFGFTSKIATVKAAIDDSQKYNLYVLCSNTYNWSPDWGIQNFIDKQAQLGNANVMLITLGSGATARSKRILERKVKLKNGKVIGSWEFWLMKPNDENRMEESNIEVAKDKVKILCGQTLENRIE